MPFASGEAVKVPPPSLALCPRRPDGVSCPGRPAVPWPPNLLSHKASQTQAPGGARQGGPLPRRQRGQGCTPAEPLGLLRTSGAGVSRLLSITSFPAEAAPAGLPGQTSVGCSLLKPSQGRDGRGRTALQWPACQTARVGPCGVRDGRPVSTRLARPWLDMGCLLLHSKM